MGSMWASLGFASSQVVRPLRFECSMLQAPYEDNGGVLRYRDVNCEDPCDYATLWERDVL